MKVSQDFEGTAFLCQLVAISSIVSVDLANNECKTVNKLSSARLSLPIFIRSQIVSSPRQWQTTKSIQ